MRESEKWQKTLKLHDELGPLLRAYLKRTFRIQEPDVDDMIQETFEKVFSNLESVHSKDYKSWVFSIAKNVTLTYLRKTQRLLTNYGEPQDDENRSSLLKNIEEAIAAAENLEEALCMQWCVEKGLAAYERDYPDVLCPLVVTLSELKRPIEEVAAIIHRTVPETKKRLKQCQKEKKRYKDYYNEYQKAHGIEALCWLVFYLKMEGWDRKEIGALLNKSEEAVGMTLSRCKQKLIAYLEKCLADCE
jgi:RNA polymerase sigma factor (sigma-70 family)